jgi:hypothetical protein
VDLLRFVAHQRQPGALMLVGAYRPHEIRAGIAASIADLATAAELVALQGLSAPEVEDLVRAVAGTPAAGWARLVHDRSGGHPFFARELCHLLVAGGTPTQVPAVVREAIGRRLANLSMPCLGLLDAAAATGIVLPDVLADVSGADAARIAELIAEAAKAGMLSPADGTNAIRFTHDLYRETIYASLALAQRLDLHHRIAAALLRRRERGSSMFPAELARHFAAAVSVAGSAPAVAWAQAAADADAIRFAADNLTLVVVAHAQRLYVPAVRYRFRFRRVPDMIGSLTVMPRSARLCRLQGCAVGRVALTRKRQATEEPGWGRLLRRALQARTSAAPASPAPAAGKRIYPPSASMTPCRSMSRRRRGAPDSATAKTNMTINLIPSKIQKIVSHVVAVSGVQRCARPARSTHSRPRAQL